jgi:hypothetical protein
MTLNLSIFLFAYLIYILMFVIFSFFNIYHIRRFGFSSYWAYVIIFSYIFFSVVTLAISFYFVSRIDWSAPIMLLSVPLN